MPRILFLPETAIVEASNLESVLSASLRAGIPLTNECRGNAQCSTCRVLVLNGLEFARNEKEQALAAQLHLTESSSVPNYYRWGRDNETAHTGRKGRRTHQPKKGDNNPWVGG